MEHYLEGHSTSPRVMIPATRAFHQTARSGAHGFRSHRLRPLLILCKYCRIRANSVPANGSYRSEEPFYFFSALKAGFENLVQKQQLKPGSIVVLLVGLPWSADLSRQLLARLGRPEAVAAFLTIDWSPDQDSSYPLDLHLTAKGHAEMANRIIKVIRDRCYLNQKIDEDENIHCGSFITIL